MAVPFKGSVIRLGRTDPRGMPAHWRELGNSSLSGCGEREVLKPSSSSGTPYVTVFGMNCSWFRIITVSRLEGLKVPSAPGLILAGPRALRQGSHSTLQDTLDI
jgi:hypothetical protein